MSDCFADRLVERIEQTGSILCVGLDPDLAQMPPELLDGVEDLASAARAAKRWSCAIVDGVAATVPAVKPQSAFFEQWGVAGMAALEQVIDHARRAGVLVVEDAKRGDIGSTMAAYAAASIGRVEIAGKECPVHDADAVTVSPYLGGESLAPMVEAAERWGKGVFVLVRTSNPESGAVQQLQTQDGALYEQVGRMVAELAQKRVGRRGYSDVGAVVGLTYPADAARLRKLMQRSFFLVPGLGAQGGRAEDVKELVDENGLGALVAASRAVAEGWREHSGAGGAETAIREGASRRAAELGAQLRAVVEGDHPRA